MTLPLKISTDCKCNFTQYMVGDGCSVCNPRRGGNVPKWTQEHIEWLFILRKVLKYDFTLCADLMNREFNAGLTKSAVIGLYNRQLKKGYQLPVEVVKEVKEAMKQK